MVRIDTADCRVIVYQGPEPLILSEALVNDRPSDHPRRAKEV